MLLILIKILGETCLNTCFTQTCLQHALPKQLLNTEQADI